MNEQIKKITAIQIGTGVSANVVGYLNEAIPLSTIFQYSALYALAAGLLGVFLHVGKQKAFSLIQ